MCRRYTPRSKEFANSQLLTTLSSSRVPTASWGWNAPVIGITPARRYRTIIELRCELTEQLENPMRLRMASDVPLGAFLSGGVDSFAVVAMMARIGGGTVKTFSKWVFGKKHNETGYARMAAQRYA